MINPVGEVDPHLLLSLEEAALRQAGALHTDRSGPVAELRDGVLSTAQHLAEYLRRRLGLPPGHDVEGI